MDTSKEQLAFGSAMIEYDLSYQDRKTLGIRVFPDCSVKVSAPFGASKEQIVEKLREKAPWVLKQQRDFLSFHPLTPPRRYISGETHLYLGKQYRLKVVGEAAEGRAAVVLGGGRLTVSAPDGSPEKVRQLLEEWYRQRALLKFPEILSACMGRFKGRHQLPPGTPELYIQKMEKRWGSCTPKGKILLNVELVKAPKACIEYVIVHELCHLIHHNHTRAFYALQAAVMPDWKKWKERLERAMV